MVFHLLPRLPPEVSILCVRLHCGSQTSLILPKGVGVREVIQVACRGDGQERQEILTRNVQVHLGLGLAAILQRLLEGMTTVVWGILDVLYHMYVEGNTVCMGSSLLTVLSGFGS